MFISLRIAVLLAITTELGSVWTEKVLCTRPMDLAFLIDNSASIWNKDFKKEKDFVIEIIQSLDVSPTKIKVAAVTFSNASNVVFDFNDEVSQDSAITKLSNLKHKYGGTTDTHDGLAVVRKQVFNAGNGDRLDYPNVLILLTDGDSTNQEKTVEAAKLLKDDEVTIIAIGVGNVTEDKLKPLSTPPDSENYIYAKTFSVLKTKLQSVVLTTCKAPEIVFGLYGIEPLLRERVAELNDAIVKIAFDISKGNALYGIREGRINTNSNLTNDLGAVTFIASERLQSIIDDVLNTFKTESLNNIAVLFLNTDASDLDDGMVKEKLKELRNYANIVIVGIGEGFSPLENTQLSVPKNNVLHGDIQVVDAYGLDKNMVSELSEKLKKAISKILSTPQ